MRDTRKNPDKPFEFFLMKKEDQDHSGMLPPNPIDG